MGSRRSRRNPALFVAGCPRSGTTVLQRMLDAHVELAVVNEARFIPLAPWAARGGRSSMTEQRVRWVLDQPRLHVLGLDERAVRAEASAAAGYSEFVSRLFDTYAGSKGKRLAGDKTPMYIRRLPILHGLFPWARTLHIIRDGRDAALSIREWAEPKSNYPRRFELWEEEPIAVCALWWRWLVSVGRRDGEPLGPRHYREVMYERLVADPEPELRTITDFLGLSFDPAMLTFHRGKTRQRAGISSKKAWLPAQPGLRDWRAQMSRRDLQLFEALAGDLLADLGYELATSGIPPSVRGVARRCQDRWAEEMDRWRREEERKLGAPPP
jgi:hypothetical protein